MKKLSLSKEQRDKLMEMCKELFPEFNNIRYGKNWEYDDVWMDSIPSSKPDPIEIHWFELCITELAVRLEKLISEDPEHRTIMDFIPLVVIDELTMNGKHPIDTLYSEYKKLKNEGT